MWNKIKSWFKGKQETNLDKCAKYQAEAYRQAFDDALINSMIEIPKPKPKRKPKAKAKAICATPSKELKDAVRDMKKLNALQKKRTRSLVKAKAAKKRKTK
jgi:hypothetical protein